MAERMIYGGNYAEPYYGSYYSIYTTELPALTRKFEELFTRFQNGAQSIAVRPIFDTDWRIKAISFT